MNNTRTVPMWRVARIEQGVVAECEACEYTHYYPRASLKQASVWIGRHYEKNHR